MKNALILIAACAMAYAQTKSTTAPKSAATAKAGKAKAGPAIDVMKPETMKAKAPAIFIVRLETTKGNIDIRVVHNWAPTGVDRFYNLVRAGYYDNNYFFRVLDFMAQVGISSKPAVNQVWDQRTMFDDRVIEGNHRGAVTFAQSSEPNSRGTQFFINKTDNSRLDAAKFAAFGEVVEGMDAVDKLYGGYGEPPVQDQLAKIGEPFILKEYPRMDKIIKATVLQVVEP
jgi:peptidyl-prolyl cis-trans isomerase A (cyclophilin A)